MDESIAGGRSLGSVGDGEIVWRPTPAHLERSRLWQMMRRHGIETYAEMVRRSVADLEWFWNETLRDLGLEWFRPYDRVLDVSRGIPWARWWVNGQYNYVHNAVDRHALSDRRDRPALIWEGEGGETRRLSFAEVYAETNRVANALRRLGVGKGDRVGIFMPMVPEVAIASLACSKIGAIYIPIFSGFAAPAVASRLQDAGARLLITADGFYRRGSTVPTKETADEAVRQSPGVERVLVFRRTGKEVPWHPEQDVWWHEAVARESAECATERTDAEDPYMIIYTSGTTGRPKGALHVHGGFPIKATQDLAHCFDLREDDILFWLTDMGWMMGPWAIKGALTLGAACFLFEGTPDYPGPDRLWDMVERHRVTVLGISPTAIRALMGRGEDWVRRHDLSSLRALGSTGEPWNPEPWRWCFENVGGGRCPIVNYCGGTEISGGIMSGTTITPLKPCSFAGAVPGMDADVVDERGQPLRGSVGEVIIRQPWPGMTRGFWKDPDRYLETYWSRWPNVWVHGDWALIDEDGFWYILGRSDDTIKVAGKRVGPAEVESAAVAHPAVAEAAAIGVPNELKGEVVVCFAILRPGYTPDDRLREEVRNTITEHLGRALRPEAVRFVRDLPRTRNAKILRRVIRAKYLGLSDLGDLSSLENPAAVEEIGKSQ